MVLYMEPLGNAVKRQDVSLNRGRLLQTAKSPTKALDSWLAPILQISIRFNISMSMSMSMSISIRVVLA